jgi:hypothetical protein
VKPLPFELRWARVAGRSLVPPGTLAGAVDAIDLPARLEREMMLSPWEVALAMRFSLWLLWLSPIFFLARPATFGGVDDETRVALFERLFKSRLYVIRMAAMLLKLTLCTLILGDERVLAELGAYDLQQPRRIGRAS